MLRGSPDFQLPCLGRSVNYWLDSSVHSRWLRSVVSLPWLQDCDTCSPRQDATLSTQNADSQPLYGVILSHSRWPRSRQAMAILAIQKGKDETRWHDKQGPNFSFLVSERLVLALRA